MTHCPDCANKYLATAAGPGGERIVYCDRCHWGRDRLRPIRRFDWTAAARREADNPFWSAEPARGLYLVGLLVASLACMTLPLWVLVANEPRLTLVEGWWWKYFALTACYIVLATMVTDTDGGGERATGGHIDSATSIGWDASRPLLWFGFFIIPGKLFAFSLYSIAWHLRAWMREATRGWIDRHAHDEMDLLTVADLHAHRPRARR